MNESELHEIARTAGLDAASGDAIVLMDSDLQHPPELIPDMLDIVGWSSVLSVILLIGGFQLLLMGVLAEYVVRIFEESKGRPLYILRNIRHDATSDVAKTSPE